MFYYLQDGDPEIDGMMRSVCETGGGGKKVRDISISLRDYPETADRAAESVATAKRPPRSERHRKTKTFIYRVQYNSFRRRFERDPDSIAVAWNGLTGTRRAFMAAAKDAGRPRIFMERAPLPGRVTVDPQGINQLSCLPRQSDFYLDWANGHDTRNGKAWMELGKKMTARASKRTDVGQAANAAGLDQQKFIFCPLQVPDDTQIRQFAGWVGDLDRFIEVLAGASEHLPEGWHLRFKEHPSSKIPLGEVLSAAAKAHPGRIVIDNQTDTFRQVDASAAVITLNSSVGLQSFFYDKPVLVLGEAFFNFEGLVKPVHSPGHLAEFFEVPRLLSYDERLRDAFMNYLDQVYYPEVTLGSDGKPVVNPENVRKKIEQSRTLVR
ncbi:capsular biosynthesis protein [Qingshengfaniella alkalisoli]|uniref:Capsular biosynthesis protein n=1 Tax=Qingshengfaniella alkalisoli TaxID=2599296 RepID=A0A5B8I9R2_9RHOB|nr:capsular biosynthesis protein [Qingshengfaniella alkalisoli]QDY69786.1 capsular biosynthesis protein [Qingshengfaniella alkalisoli]